MKILWSEKNFNGLVRRTGILLSAIFSYFMPNNNKPQKIKDIQLRFTETLTEDVRFSCFISDTDGGNFQSSSEITIDIVGTFCCCSEYSVYTVHNTQCVALTYTTQYLHCNALYTVQNLKFIYSAIFYSSTPNRYFRIFCTHR